MNIDFKLDFFYYNEMVVLDGIDPKMIELKPHINKFKTFLTTQSLEKTIELFIYVYRDKYAQTFFWTSSLYDVNSPSVKEKYPANLDENTDWFLGFKNMNRDDIQHIHFKRIFDLERVCYFSNYTEFAFIKKQNVGKFKDGIEKSLNGKQYQVLQSNGQITYIVENSPIAKIEIATEKIKIIFNPEKWIAYYGLG